MVSKTMKAMLAKKVQDWIDSIPEGREDVRRAIKENVFITGGAIVSMLQGEAPNDFDVYFRTMSAARIVGGYYVDMFNARRTKGTKAELQEVVWHKPSKESDWRREGWRSIDQMSMEDLEGEHRLRVFIKSQGVAMEDGSAPREAKDLEEYADDVDLLTKDTPDEDKQPRYRPIFLSSNAITLSNKIQIVLRFFGEPTEVHKNYDFVHCTCYWQSWDHHLELPARALEAIINKELYYIGSKYPLCSIVRARKFIKRGWNINAGQYLKMVLQLNEMDLTNPGVFEEQLTGVDSFYFNQAIAYLRKRVEEDPEFRPTVPYLVEIINNIF